MSADRNPLDEFLESISDGTAVDWDAAVRAATTESRSRVEALRDVSRIAAFNRDLQRSPLPAPPGSNVPEQWGDLLLLERLGTGSQAEVFRAWDPKLRREVALKLLRPEVHGQDPTVVESPLIAEGRAAARIRHPHVVAVHGIDQHGGRVGLWMELVRGTSLEQEVRTRGPLSPDDARRLGCEVGSALAAVHAAGVLHRDVKPANVVRDPDGRFVLTDFGLGASAHEAASLAAWPSGTPMYMAPELLLGAPPSARSDTYALGMLLWFALAGRHPFDAPTVAALRDAAAKGPSPALRMLRPDLPAALVATVERAIAPVPEQRFATAQQLVDALVGTTAAAASRPAGAATAAPRRRRLPLATAAALVAVAAIAVVVAVVVTPRLRREPPPAPGSAGERMATAPGSATDAYSVEASFLLRNEGGAVHLVSGDRVAPGDHLSLEVRASREAWVYVLNEDERGERYLLFPQPLFDVQNPLPADKTFVLPGTVDGRENAWTVTSAGGHEHFLVVVSPEPVAELESDLERLPAPAPGRPVEYAAVTAATVERLRGTGGLAEVGASPPPASTSAGAFDRVRALAGRETDVRGIWMRQVVLDNPAR